MTKEFQAGEGTVHTVSDLEREGVGGLGWGKVWRALNARWTAGFSSSLSPEHQGVSAGSEAGQSWIRFAQEHGRRGAGSYSKPEYGTSWVLGDSVVNKGVYCQAGERDNKRQNQSLQTRLCDTGNRIIRSWGDGRPVLSGQRSGRTPSWGDDF